MADFLASNLDHIGTALGAIAALGTAAYGLVDATKAFGGGISLAGFGYIEQALTPFAPALVAAGGANWSQTLKGHWINGRSKDDQKAIAKGLIHLGLSPLNAAELAVFGGVDAAALRQVVTALAEGTPLLQAQINVLGRFDSMVDASLDGAYERADQYYRNWSKVLAAIVAIVLAVAGAYLIAASQNQSLGLSEAGLAFLVGVVAVPLAPIAKDISSALVAAVKALKGAGA